MSLSTSIKDRIKAVLAYRVCATNEDDTQQEEKLTTYCEVVNYLRTSYATGDVIVQVEAEITNSKQPEEVSIVRYSELLRDKALRLGRIYDESLLKRVLIERLHKYILFAMRTWSAAQKGTTLQNLVRYAISLPKVQEKHKRRSLRSKNHGESRGRKITYNLYKKRESYSSCEFCTASCSVSSPTSSSRRASKRSERRKCQK